MTTILADRIEADLIERLDGIRDALERAHNYELEEMRTLVDNALRAATDYLAQLREARHAGADRE
jgi:hypothetical protein